MADKLGQFLSSLGSSRHDPADCELWRNSVVSLVELLRNSLEAERRVGQVSEVETIHRLTEPDFGTYEIPTLRMTFSNGDSVELAPRGGQIVGAIQNGAAVSKLAGRVDLVHMPSSRVIPLYRAELGNGIGWYVLDPNGKENLRELTGKHLRDLIAELLGAGTTR